MQAMRVGKELNNIKKNPPWGISCNCIKEGVLDKLEASIMGPRDSPYDGGAFRIQIDIPAKYPFEPPQVKFLTPVYHPNIDKGGRICLDLVKMPPAGSWKPTVALEALLLAVQALLDSPNPDDPLMLDIAQQFKVDRPAFDAEAREYTKKYAM